MCGATALTGFFFLKVQKFVSFSFDMEVKFLVIVYSIDMVKSMLQLINH